MGHPGHPRLSFAAPRGVVKLSARALEALEQLDAGATRKEICERYGVSAQAVSRWVSLRRESQKDPGV